MIWGKKKKLELIRKAWGKPLERFRNMDFISIYHNDVESIGKAEYIDDRTWSDLNLDTLFSIIDRNSSYIGQQYTYHLLRTYESDENILKKRFELIELFKKNKSLRERIQLHLLSLQETNTYFIPDIILNDDLPFFKYYRLFYLMVALTIISGALITVNGIFFFMMFGFLVFNVFVGKLFARKINNYFSGFAGLNSLIIAAQNIGYIKTDFPVEEIDFLKAHRGLLRRLSKKLGRFVIDKTSMNEVMLAVIEYLNMFFMYDMIAYFRSVNTLKKFQAEIHEVYKAVASIDTYISIASYLEEIIHFSNPVFCSDKLLSFENISHPLIEDAVSNSMEKLNKSALITGSNMSGKTTFVKTLGVNAVLAQTFYFCLADKFVLPKLIVKSAIKREDDLENNKSYFFVEVEELQEFLELSGNADKYLFIIDEIFRGTNTVERLAASTAVLKYLDRNNFVLVTTHDIELQELLQNSFEMLHFSEMVENKEYYFDYKLRRGPCTSGNAIKLMEIKNYPNPVISEANLLVKTLLGKNSTPQ
jgi:hypothetical protein